MRKRTKSRTARTESLRRMYHRRSEGKLTLVIKAVDTVDRSAFVIATEDEEVFGVLNLVGKEETYGFEALLAPIHVVAKEKIIGCRRESSILKQPEEVVILAVNIA